ncbi:MAG: NapC/NirT family cytochrome c [Chloroflexi bacterium]|nr:NapC/NirT family cytochrome c [Chloroflexota bacterium]
MTTPPPETAPPRRKRRLSNLVLDLSKQRHRRFVLVFVLASFLIATGFLFGGIKVYQYTESSEFCGSVCHPMGSQFDRYEVSAHAHVECAECHIGPGASFFVKSKIDGIRQVVAVLTHSYSRPIKSPVENLRPARETCETCHSPTSYRDNVIKTHQHYDSDEANTPVRSTLILKMGGWKESTGVAHGIHWHITNEVYYIATDRARQNMAWVGVKQPDGALKEYYSREALTLGDTSFVEEARASEEMRLLDCIDCHNRAAHYIPPPDIAVDQAIADGLISSGLPFIRAKAVEALLVPYRSVEEASLAIDDLTAFYRVSYPNTYAQRQGEVEKSIEEIKHIYSQTNFPDMALDWQTNPNNERHNPDLGCFRCHDGQHLLIDENGSPGEAISAECNLCHTVPIVGRGEDLLVEAPVIVGEVPADHQSFAWTVSHRNVQGAEEQSCHNCHGQGFCNNGACHNLEHPEDMLFSHAEVFRVASVERGEQVCYTCHQDITCTQCHPGGIVGNP